MKNVIKRTLGSHSNRLAGAVLSGCPGGGEFDDDVDYSALPAISRASKCGTAPRTTAFRKTQQTAVFCLGLLVAFWAVPARAYLPAQSVPTGIQMEVDLVEPEVTAEAVERLLEQVLRDAFQLIHESGTTGQEPQASSVVRRACKPGSRLWIASSADVTVASCVSTTIGKVRLVLNATRSKRYPWHGVICGLGDPSASKTYALVQALKSQFDTMGWRYRGGAISMEKIASDLHVGSGMPGI